MLTLLKLVRSLFNTLHSDGSPGQIAAGVALGAALGLTPIANAHNLVVFLLLAVLNVSFAAGLLAWAYSCPSAFYSIPSSTASATGCWSTCNRCVRCGLRGTTFRDSRSRTSTTPSCSEA